MSHLKPIAILRTGSTFAELKNTHGDFDQWIAKGLGDYPVISSNVIAGDALPDATELSGAVITGSHAMVTDREAWSEGLAEWIRAAHVKELPLLGICYGHQLIAHALGGRVDYRAQGIELGTHCVTKTEFAQGDILLGDLPLNFDGHLVHSQSVIELPPGARLLAASEKEPHQCYRVGRATWGVQFHPEFDEEVMGFYIAEIRKTHNPMESQEIGNVRKTHDAAKILERFAEVAENSAAQ